LLFQSSDDPFVGDSLLTYLSSENGMFTTTLSHNTKNIQSIVSKPDNR